MRHYLKERINKHIETCRAKGRRSQANQQNYRLQAALECGPIRSIEGRDMLYVLTYNPRTETEHFKKIRHEIDNGNDRYNVYLDKQKWRNGWSKTRFVKWFFEQIEKVRILS